MSPESCLSIIIICGEICCYGVGSNIFLLSKAVTVLNVWTDRFVVDDCFDHSESLNVSVDRTHSEKMQVSMSQDHEKYVFYVAIKG